ncbi:RNA polymerase sigma factor [Marinicrinis lubricantis]
MEREDDLELILRMMRGSHEAFEHFYECHIPFMYRIALSIVHDPMEAEDICHDVVMELIGKWDQYDPSRGSLKSWVAVRTKSRALDRVRKRQRVIAHASVEPEVKGSERNIEEQALFHLEKQELAHAMQSIPEVQRRAVYEAYFEERTHRELSEEMRQPLGTVKSWIRYGLRNMKKQLEQRGWFDSGGGVREHDR